ncbi:hypothetical protein BSKO_13824 [Bryopsis sp. KO-2023]|nr:hypothetical protein BSKO_13824 [Bryopsis sp. KO-2023]
MPETKRGADEGAANPIAKRQRKDFEEYTLNVNLAVDKEDEVKSFGDLAASPVEVVQGIAEKGAAALEPLGVKTVKDLGTNKFFRWARAIVTLAGKEEEGKRGEGAMLNIDRAVVKDYEKSSLKEIAAAPVAALQGISDKTALGLKSLHVTTVKDLAENKYARWCEAISTLAETERLDAENAQLKRLS